MFVPSGIVTSWSSTAVSLQFAGAVIEIPGVPVTVPVADGLAYGVLVAGSVAVTKSGVGFDWAGPESDTSQALNAATPMNAIQYPFLIR